MPADPTVTRVAYVGGAGRSGSTLLALLLSRIPGFVPVGGLNNLWERGLRDNYLCGCGTHFRECSFWSKVGREAFGGWDALDVQHIIQLKFAVTRYRHWPWHFAPRLRPVFLRSLNEYSGYMARLYTAIRSVSGCRVIVDNSHDVMPALLLRQMPQVRGYILHLVRDSRGVTFSLSKRVRRSEATTNPEYMPQYRPVQASIEWVIANVPYHLMHPAGLPRLRIRYESLTASPAIEIARIGDFLGAEVPPTELALFEEQSIDISDNHMVSGNPHRLGRHSVQIRLDDEWRSRMKVTDRMIVTLLTSPLAVAYGYVGCRSSADDRVATRNSKPVRTRADV